MSFPQPGELRSSLFGSHFTSPGRDEQSSIMFCQDSPNRLNFLFTIFFRLGEVRSVGSVCAHPSLIGTALEPLEETFGSCCCGESQFRCPALFYQIPVERFVTNLITDSSILAVATTDYR